MTADSVALKQGSHRFVLLPRRWVVQPTFAWQSQTHRLSKDYERLCHTSEIAIYVCMIRLMRRLSRR